MNLTDYQMEVRRTTAMDDRERILAFAIGLAGESGELLERIKKHRFHGEAWDVAKAREEAGDVLWYLTALCDAFGFDLEQVAIENVRKLRKRYPNGFVRGGGVRE